MLDRPAPTPSLPPLTRAARRGLVLAAVMVLLAVVLGSWGLWQAVGQGSGDDQPTPAQLQALQGRLDAMEQRNATLARSDQISRDANRDLQGALAERDEEVSGLRADVAFYERFVGATAQRRGLAVHELQLQAQTDEAWRFTATLTQNINRGAVNAGQLMLSVEGTRDGKLQKLGWQALRQPGAPGIPYSFKYFQQVEGDLVLPAGFKPVRVVARLVPKSGPAVEQSFAWKDAVVGAAEAGA
ncbi:MAG: hypothetical protein LH491_08940 [Pseudoxanthomonas sp.]|nr:hypothetical protein [Pseudoxanthomonas sp.]